MEISTCVRAFISNPHGKILLVKHKEDRPWTLPGGHVETGELFFDALTREIREEFQIKITADSLSYEAKEDFIRTQPLPLIIHSITYPDNKNKIVTKQELFYKVSTNEYIQYQQESEIFAWKWRSKEDILQSAEGVIYSNIVGIVEHKF